MCHLAPNLLSLAHRTHSLLASAVIFESASLLSHVSPRRPASLPHPCPSMVYAPSPWKAESLCHGELTDCMPSIPGVLAPLDGQMCAHCIMGSFASHGLRCPRNLHISFLFIWVWTSAVSPQGTDEGATFIPLTLVIWHTAGNLTDTQGMKKRGPHTHISREGLAL